MSASVAAVAHRSAQYTKSVHFVHQLRQTLRERQVEGLRREAGEEGGD